MVKAEFWMHLLLDITRPQSIVTDRVVWSVSRSLTLVSPAKTAEPIEMPFGSRTRVGQGNMY